MQADRGSTTRRNEIADMPATEPNTQERPTTPDAAGASAAPGGPVAPSEPAVNPVDQLRAELKEYKDKILRARAEVQNVTRRLTEEKQTALRYAHAEFARSLLPVVDNFERLLASLAQVSDADPIKHGAKLTYDLLAKTLAEHRIVAVESVGKPFDPGVHEAIHREETTAVAPGTVTVEYEKGYRLADRVLRAAKVAIAVPPSAASAESQKPSGNG